MVDTAEPLRSSMRPTLKKREDDDGDINLISTRKDKSAAAKKESVKANERGVYLFKCIKDQKWDDVLKHLDYYERDAKNWIEEVNDDGSKRWRSLPIHLVCEKNPIFEVVNQLVRIHPKCLSERNYGGDLPIHIACRQGAGKDIIKIMVEKGIETTKETDCEGRLPLHLAVCSSGIHVNSIQDIITYNEKAARTPDDFGLLPLHWACTKDATATVVETIIKIYPYAVEHKDTYGHLPIDRIKKSRNPEKAKIVELLTRDVSSWSSAMMSTIVELSSKIAAANKMEEQCISMDNRCKTLMDQNNRSFNEINGLVEKIHAMQDQFAREMRMIKGAHKNDIQKLQYDFEHEASALRRDKEDAEKKSSDLKILVDELVQQLKIQKAALDEKEGARAGLKKKAMGLLSKIEEAQKEIEARNEESEGLKMYHLKLKYEIEKRDQHIEIMTDKKNAYNDYDSYDGSQMRSTRHFGQEGKYGTDIPRTFECARVQEEDSY